MKDWRNNLISLGYYIFFTLCCSVVAWKSEYNGILGIVIVCFMFQLAIKFNVGDNAIEKKENLSSIVVSSVIFLAIIVLWGVPEIKNKTVYLFGKDNNEEERIKSIYNKLPESVKKQDKFPEAIVKHMMTGDCGWVSDIVDEDTSNKICSCVVERRVENFSMEEYVAAISSEWDDKQVHDTNVKEYRIEAECLRKVLSKQNKN